MTLQPFTGFEAYPTHHCVTGALKHIYDFHHYPISEEMLLGLGRGLGFVYFHFKGTDPFYGGRANHERPGEEGFERTVGRRTGVVIESQHTSSTRKAQESLREMLADGEPVYLYVDMGFLPYFDLPDDYHFGGHTIVVAGYEPATKQMLVADRDIDLHPVSWEALEEARGSTFKPFPPQHRWYTFDFSRAHPPEPADVVAAIGEVCRAMLEPPIANLGVKGIRKAITETRKWPKTLDPDGLRRTCANVAIFIDHRGGTGGGIFRYMYARFLGEAATLTGDPRLGDLAPDLRSIGDQWETVAERFTAASEAGDPAGHLDHATEPMNEIADREHDLWTRLLAITA
jgi:hypothetical protein